jgi:hypothetical protein
VPGAEKAPRGIPNSPVRKAVSSLSSPPYVCPEPVLVKRPLLYIHKWRFKKWRFSSLPRSDATLLNLRKTALFEPFICKKRSGERNADGDEAAKAEAEANAEAARSEKQPR